MLCFVLPEEKPVGFRLKPPTLIHGQAPSSGWYLLLVSFKLDYFKYALHSHLLRLYSSLMISVSGIPSQKPKEQQRSVLRPAVLQAPPLKLHLETSKHHSVAPSAVEQHPIVVRFQI